MRTKLIDILRTYVAPGILGGITMDSYRRQISSHREEMLKLTNSKDEKIQQMQEELWGTKFVNTEFKNKLSGTSLRIKEVDEKISETKSKLSEIESQITNENFSIHESPKDLTNCKEYLSSELKRLEGNRNELIKEIQESIDKSDIFSYFTDFLDSFRTFVDQLSLEQLVALFNLIGFGMILATLISITTILIGDYLIVNLRLEIKFPKLAKYIKIKQSLNKHYLMFYMTMFYIVVIVYIIANIYMLLLKYFV